MYIHSRADMIVSYYKKTLYSRSEKQKKSALFFCIILVYTYLCNMISKNLTKYIRSLENKKVRKKEGCFIAEGPKVVADLMEHYMPLQLVATEQWYKNNHLIPRKDDGVVTEEELRKVSLLQHPQQVIGIFPITEAPLPSPDDDTLYLALDGIQDPGNMGTIIRIADWFGITTLICSKDTADIYNPKCVQATMGSIARVNVIYTDMEEWLAGLPADYPVYGTFLNGNNIYKEDLSTYGIIIMGNEGNGISEVVGKYVNKRILIPNYPEVRPTADSLNVAIATAITCAEFRRR